jgi:hypothetical protein
VVYLPSHSFQIAAVVAVTSVALVSVLGALATALTGWKGPMARAHVR